MHLSAIFAFIPLLLAPTVSACAACLDCKCHDSRTGLQNDAVTKAACAAYGANGKYQLAYSDAPYHQVRSTPIASYSLSLISSENELNPLHLLARFRFSLLIVLFAAHHHQLWIAVRLVRSQVRKS
jgi:hypothetical protein